MTEALRVVRGQPTDEELAALAVVLHRLARREPEPSSAVVRRAGWSARRWADGRSWRSA